MQQDVNIIEDLPIEDLVVEKKLKPGFTVFITIICLHIISE